jgi:O-antigen/teichoic acid export membrane protein
MSLVGFCVFFIIRKEINYKISIPSLDIIKKDISLGLPLALSFLVETMMIVGDRYVIALFMTVKDVGNYSAAYSIGAMSIIIAKVFNVIIPIFISKIIDSGDTENSSKIIKIALRVYLIFAVPFMFGSFLFAKEILEIFTNKESAEAAWLIIPIISSSSIFFGVNMILSIILFVQKKTKIIFKINLNLAIINLLLNLFLIGIFRTVEIAAITTVISYLIGSIWLINYLNKEWLEGINFRYITYVNLISLIMFSLVLFLKSILIVDSLIIKTSILVIFSILLYLLIIFITKKIIKKDMLLIKRIFFNLNNK